MHPLLRQIWANPDCLLLIYVGSSAEFALSPKLDWLFYTGRLPADPIYRLQSTLNFMRRLIFSPTESLCENVARGLRQVHTDIETRRGQTLPNEAYLDVLSMKIRYTIDAYELVYGRRLDEAARDEITAAFGQMGQFMGLTGMARDYAEFQAARRLRLPDLVATEWTWKLMAAYRQSLGWFGYRLLHVVYGTLVEPQLLTRLKVRRGITAHAVRWGTPTFCRSGLNWPTYRLIFPPLLWTTVTGWRDSPTLALE